MNEPTEPSAPQIKSPADKQRELSHFVMAKTGALFEGLSKGESQARGRLARLRRSAEGDRRLWMLVGDDLFDDNLGKTHWNIALLGEPTEQNYYFIAAITALRFYALHQQSQTKNVNASDWSASFGRACASIGQKDSKDRNDSSGSDSDTAGPGTGVQRRLYAMERSRSFDELVVHMRGLVTLLRSTDSAATHVNYGRLAIDLYHLQLPSQRERVFREWSHDFYYPHLSHGDSHANGGSQPSASHKN